MGGTISAASRDASKRCHVLVPGASATQEESAPRPSGLPRAVAGFPPLRSMSPGRKVAYGDRVDTCTGVGVERRGYYFGINYENGQPSGCPAHPNWFDQDA